MRKKIAKYLNSHINNIYEGKKVLVIGSTGLLGESLVSLLWKLKAEVTVSTTNKEKALRLFSLYKLNIIECNLLNLDSVNYLISYINNIGYDYVFINSGYASKQRCYINDLEYHYLINFYSPYKIISSINKSIKVIVTASISYKYSNIDISNLNGDSIKVHDLYGISKKMLLISSVLLKEEGYNISISHPGIVYSSLFKTLNNVGFKRLILPLIRPFMLKPDYAVLNMIQAGAIDMDNKYWVGPKYFNAFGSPKLSRIKKLDTNYKLSDFIYKE